MNNIKIGLLGLGTVGTGVYKLIGMRSDIMEKTIGAQIEVKRHRAEQIFYFSSHEEVLFEKGLFPCCDYRIQYQYV